MERVTQVRSFFTLLLSSFIFLSIFLEHTRPNLYQHGFAKQTNQDFSMLF